MFATPQDNGLWNVEGDNSLNVSGHFKGPDQKRTDFTYSIASMVYTSVFDPAISYFRSGDFSAKDIKVTTATDTEQVNASFGDMKYKLTSAVGASADRTDFAANGTLTAFAEQVSGKEMPPLQITADTIDFDAKVNSLPAKQLRDIVVFAVDHAEEKQMSKESEEKLKDMLARRFSADLFARGNHHPQQSYSDECCGRRRRQELRLPPGCKWAEQCNAAWRCIECCRRHI